MVVGGSFCIFVLDLNTGVGPGMTISPFGDNFPVLFWRDEDVGMTFLREDDT